MPETNRQWILAKRPEGGVKRECFELRESPVPEIRDGQFLVKNELLSCDPTQKGWMEMDTYLPKIEIGEVIRAGAAGEVVASKNPDFAVGDRVQGMFGWQEYCVSEGGGLGGATKLPEGVPLETAMSLLGLTGLTAYFGMIDVARVKEGDVVLVSGAAGSTGSIAAQIAKAKGARTVIGIAGGEKKKSWLLDKAKLDGAIDYKNENVAARIGELAPEGLNVYFDNVGGEILEAALDHLAIGARIALCGAISGYNDFSQMQGPRNYVNLIIRRASMEGFLVLDYMDRMMEAVGALAEWAQAGKIVHEVTVAEGIEKAPEAFQNLFTGGNLGKQLVRV